MKRYRVTYVALVQANGPMDAVAMAYATLHSGKPIEFGYECPDDGDGGTLTVQPVSGDELQAAMDEAEDVIEKALAKAAKAGPSGAN